MKGVFNACEILKSVSALGLVSPASILPIVDFGTPLRSMCFWQRENGSYVLFMENRGN